MTFLRELFSIHRFFFKTPKKDKQIIFYAEHAGYYPYFEGAIDELTKKHDETICYITSDINDPILKNSSQTKKIKPFYLKKLLPWFMAIVNTKVFVMTLTDLHKFHLRRSINPVHYVYMFHALVSTHMMYNEGAFDHYDTIICCGPHHKKEIREREKQENLPPKNLVESGYYRLENLYKKKLEQANKVSPSMNTDKKTILIAPSWGEHNIIKTCGKELIKTILEQTNYNIILRPHPETTKRSPELLQEYKNLFGENQNFTLESAVTTKKGRTLDDSMLLADLLITDLSGIALEYALGTEQPVLFIDLPYKIKNKFFKKLGIEPLEISIRSEIGSIIAPSSIPNIKKQIEKLFQKQDFFKTKMRQLRKKYVYGFAEKSSSETRAQPSTKARPSTKASPSMTANEIIKIKNDKKNKTT